MYNVVGADGNSLTLSITDTQTGVATAIENVHAARPQCPANDDPWIHVWLKGSDGLLTFWRGPYTALEQATLPFLVRTALLFTTKASLVQAAAPETPAAFGLVPSGRNGADGVGDRRAGAHDGRVDRRRDAGGIAGL